MINAINSLVLVILSVIGTLAYAEPPCRNSGYKSGTSLKVNSPLLICAKVLPKKYKARDDIEFVIILWNQSSADVYIPRKEGFSIDVSFRIRDHVTGKFLETNFIPTRLPPPPMSAKDLLKISQHSYVEDKINISLMDFNIEVGRRYDFIFEYKSSLPKSMNFGVNIFDAEKRVLISDPIPIDIGDN